MKILIKIIKAKILCKLLQQEAQRRRHLIQIGLKVLQFQMRRQNRTSVGHLLEQSSEIQHSKQQQTDKSAEINQSQNELTPVHAILKQYIRESGCLGSIRSTFKAYSEREQRETQKGACNPTKISEAEEAIAKIALNQIEAICITKMGIRNYDNMENQDVIMQDSLGDKCRLYGIFDGHGEHGKDLALTAKKIFQSLLHKYNDELRSQASILSIQTIVRKVLEKTNSYLLHYKSQEAQYSGTTALIVVLTASTIYVFNIGNSRLVLGKFYETTQKTEAFQVTHDHTLARFDERLRITKSGGLIAPFKNEMGEFIGPERIWAPNEKYPGLTVTRTMGLSCSYKLGVNSEPEISILKFKSCYKFLVLGSDGLWTVEDNDQVVSLLSKSHPRSLSAHANTLILQALKRWRARQELMDDVSIIVIPLISQ